MDITIDGFFMNNEFSSMGIFQRNLIENLLRIDQENRYHIIGSNSERDSVDGNMVAQPYSGPRDLFSRMAFLNNYMRKNSIGFLLATFNLSPLLMKKNVVFQVSHDWSHGIKDRRRRLNLSGKLYQQMHKSAVRRARINIANSQFTARETLKFSGKNSSVVYHDCDPFYKAKVQLRDKGSPLQLDGDFVLYVGRVRPTYKNVNSLLASFNELQKERRELKLVIVSSDDFSPSDGAFIRKNKMNIAHLKHVPKEQVRELYMNAWVTVYPSTYEGFGSPLLEAQASGSPLIVSRCGPLPEVAGNGAMYFNGSASDLLRKLEELDNNIRSALIWKGKENANRFSWKRTAREIKSLISQGISCGVQ